MIMEKIIKAELTPTESETLQKAVDVIDNLITELQDENLSRIYTDENGFSISDLEEIADDLSSLKSLNEAD